jgi:hypothetical protein
MISPWGVLGGVGTDAKHSGSLAIGQLLSRDRVIHPGMSLAAWIECLKSTYRALCPTRGLTDR